MSFVFLYKIHNYKYTKVFVSDDLTRQKYGAVNIRNRVSTTVLCKRLLKQLGNGAYEPRKMSKDKVKDVLLSYRTNNLKVVENL